MAEKATISGNEASKKAGPLLTGLVALVLIVIVVLGVIVIRGVLRKPVPRTAAEREILTWQEYVNRNPDEPGNHYNLGLAYFGAGQNERAKDELEIAVKLDKNFFDAYIGLALVFRQEKEYSPAVKELKKVLKKKPDHLKANFQLGVVYYEQKKYSKAAKIFTKVLAVQPEAADAHYYLGLSFEKTGQRDSAINEFKQALKYVPDYKDAEEALKRVQGNEGKKN